MTISQAERDQFVAKARRMDERGAQRREKQIHPGRASSILEDPYEKKALSNVAGYVLPHLRGNGESGRPTNKKQQSHSSAPLSKQMQKRLVIREDQDYEE